METANKSEAERCLELAKKARDSGDVEKARRMAEKSLRLCSTQKAKDFINELDNFQASDGVEGNEEERGGEGVRRRRRGSESGAEGAPEEEEEMDYTPEQREAVKRVLRCKDYYDILDVSRSATEADLKKQYRRLALQLHPDKNRAPKADEAFKAVSNAYGVLSDKEKRDRYDRFGEEGIRSSGHSHYYGDTDAEQLFRTFFGGNFSFDDVFMTPYGNNYQFRFRRPHHRYHETRREPVSGWVQLFQMMPVLLILSLSLFATFIYPILHTPPYLFYPTSSHPVQRYTKRHKISYYVTESFKKDYPTPGSISKLEREVYSVKTYELREQCYEDRRRQGMLYSRRQGQNTQKLPQSCQELQKLLNG